MFLLVFVIIAAGVWICYYYWWLNGFLKDLPTIWINPFIVYNKSFVEIFEQLIELTKNIDRLGKFWAGPVLVVCTHHPDDIRTVLMSYDCLERPYLYRFLAGGTGLLTAYADVWKSHRKQINAAFTPAVLKSFVPIFNRKARILLSILDEKVNQPTFNISEYLFACNADASLEISMNYESQMQQGEDKKLLKGIARILLIAVERSRNVFLHPTFLFKFSALYREQESLIQLMMGYIVKARKKCTENLYNSMTPHHDSSSISDVEGETLYEAPPINLLKILDRMERQGIIDETALQDHINTMGVAATDTTSLTLSATVLMLAIHPEIQEQVYAEIKNSGESKYYDCDTISTFNLLERVLKESMRLFPIGPFVMRTACADIKLPTHIVPKNSIFFLYIYKMHRDVKFWGQNANAFDPDRFLPDVSSKRHPHTFLPFSSGPRNCIGNKYAMISMKIQMCHLLMSYKFRTDLKMSDLVLTFELLLKVNNGYMVQLERR